MRTIRVTKVGLDKNGAAWAQGVTVQTPEEFNAELQIAATKGIAASRDGFGIINGISPEDVATLKQGDQLSVADDAHVVIGHRLGEYEVDEETRYSVNRNISVSPDAVIKRTARTYARLT